MPTVQQKLQETLTDLFQQNITVHPAGRTDRGVHALGQVVHFDCRGEIQIPAGRRKKLINKYLPDDIRVLKFECSNFGFHARHSAVWRVYGYRFCRGKGDNPFRTACWLFEPRNWQAGDYHRGLDLLAGGVPTAVFSGSGGSNYEAETWPVKLKIKQRGSAEIWLLAGAESFRYRMVRCLAGAFGRVFAGEWNTDDLKKIITGKNRTVKPAPADGCYLTKVFYENKNNWQEISWNKISQFFK